MIRLVGTFSGYFLNGAADLTRLAKWSVLAPCTFLFGVFPHHLVQFIGMVVVRK